MNLTALLKVQQENSGEQPNNINFIVANALIFIVENYFVHLAPSFTLTLSCRDPFFCKYYNDLLGNLFKTWQPPPMQTVNISPNCFQFIPGFRDVNLILVESYETFRAIDIISYTGQNNHNEFYYIYLQNYDKYLDNEMVKIFDYCWENYLINCNVQIQNEKRDILIYTYYPFTPESCGKPNIRLINQFKNGKLTNEILFPNKLLNFYGCPLKAAMFHAPPYVYLKELNNGSGFMQRGIEVRLVRELAQRLNFSIEVKVPSNDERRGFVNGTKVTGALYMLQQRTADFSVGCFRLSQERAEVATPTLSYYQTTFVICIPKSAYNISSLEILFFPFEVSTWLLILTIWILLLFVVWLITKNLRFYLHHITIHVDLFHVYLNILLTALGMPATMMPMRFFTRLLCINWIIFSLLLRTIYQALLFYLIRVDLAYNAPNTLFDMVAENYTIIMNIAAYNALKGIELLSDMNLNIIDDVNEIVPFEYIEKYPQKNVVATGPFDYFALYVIEHRKFEVFQRLKQNIFLFPLTIYLSKHSYLLEVFNTQLMKLCSMGLIQTWTQLELNYNYINKPTPPKNEVFNFNDLYMLFVISFFGMLIASAVFLMEILSKRIRFFRKFF